MQATLWSCVLALSISAAAQTPDKPDFSGKWVLVNARGSTSDRPVALTVRQSIVRTTARGTPMTPFFSDLMVERHSASGVVSQSYKIGVEGGTAAGIPAGSSSPPHTEQEWTRFSVRWDGNSLVIETGRYSGPTVESGPYEEHVEVWSLDATRRLLVTVTDRGSASEPATSTLIYRRR